MITQNAKEKNMDEKLQNQRIQKRLTNSSIFTVGIASIAAIVAVILILYSYNLIEAIEI